MLKVELFDHQKVALQYMRLFEGFALLHSMGAGKTLPTLVRILELYKQGEIEEALIVAPKSAMGAWERDMEHFYDEDKEVLRKITHIINYESVWRKGKGYNRKWDLIVLDEAHNIKNRGAKQSDFLVNLSLHAKYRYILTGTLISNEKLHEVFYPYTFLYPVKKGRYIHSEIFGSWTQFTKEYCLLDQWWQPYAYKNVDKLQEKIEAYSHRVTTEEVLDLPIVLPDQVYKIDNKEYKLYKEVEKTNVGQAYNLLAETPLVKMMKLRQIATGFLKVDDEIHTLKSDKPKMLDEFLEGWDDKLVIFAEYKHSIDQIEKALKKRKLKYVTLDGRQKDKQIWRKFQSDDDIRVIIVQYQSGSQGIDLFASRCILFYEPTLYSNLFEQAKARVHRSGQKRNCLYVLFQTVGTIEVDIYRRLADSKDFDERFYTETIYNHQRRYVRK